MNPNEDEFLKERAGRVPKTNTLGSASTVVGENEPMRPDRSYNTLWWLSVVGGLLGLDHFYLRSPFSGLFKALTGGGFLIWWLWDMFQVMTEKERIVLYGMSAPFDIKRGFGQGTIAEGNTHFYQRSDSALWMIAAVFSFLGTDALLLGNWAEFFRKLTEGIVFCVLVWSLTTTWAENGMSGLATMGNVFKILLAILFGMIVVSGWISVMYPTFFKPEKLMTDGIKLSKKMYDILNFPSAWVRNLKYLLGEKICDRVMKEIGYAEIKGEDMNRAFKVRFRPPLDPNKPASEQQQEEEDDDTDANSTEAADKDDDIKWHPLFSYLVYVGGPLLLLVQAIKWLAVEGWKLTPWGKLQSGLEGAAKAATALAKGNIGAAVGDLAATAASAGGIPLPSGVAETVATAAKAASTVKKAKQAAETASALASNSLDATKAAAGSILPSGFDFEAFYQREHGPPNQKGGARNEEPNTQSMILGASVFALAGGAAIKLAVDYLLPTQ